MKNFILVTNKPWHDNLFDKLSKNTDFNWFRIKDKNDFTYDKLKLKYPVIIFIPHWSYIIPHNIYENFKCILFHMTDLPFGRGGSPLQNLILRGYTETQISAIKVSTVVDSGDIYMKKKLSLAGTAEEIFIRSSAVIEEMINNIIANNPIPIEQTGEIVEFKRRKPIDSNMSNIKELDSVYNHIRMLDCVGYPNAFIETEHFRLEFKRVTLKSDNSLIADVRITKK